MGGNRFYELESNGIGSIFSKLRVTSFLEQVLFHERIPSLLEVLKSRSVLKIIIHVEHGTAFI